MTDVLNEVRRLSQDRGIAVGSDYRIGRSPAEYAELAAAALDI